MNKLIHFHESTYPLSLSNIPTVMNRHELNNFPTVMNQLTHCHKFINLPTVMNQLDHCQELNNFPTVMNWITFPLSWIK